jgi:hypothetical protein
MKALAAEQRVLDAKSRDLEVEGSQIAIEWHTMASAAANRETSKLVQKRCPN